jgi:hypothetical protein
MDTPINTERIFDFTAEDGEERGGNAQVSPPPRPSGVYTVSHLRLRFALMFVALSIGTIAQAADDMTAMFNGKDLSGWVVEGAKMSGKGKDQKPIWSVRDGLLVTSGKGYGFLRYDHEVSDFIFEVDYRVSKNGNSGIGLRSPRFVNTVASRPSHAAYEVQILDDSGKPTNLTSTGALYNYIAPKLNAELPPGKWNHLHIECRGPKIVVQLNGKTVQDIDQSTIDAIKDKPLSGYLALQSHSNEVVFRDPKVKDLK